MARPNTVGENGTKSRSESQMTRETGGGSGPRRAAHLKGSRDLPVNNSLASSVECSWIGLENLPLCRRGRSNGNPKPAVRIAERYVSRVSEG